MMRSTIPRIAHLPGSNAGADDIVLSEDEARPFFTRRCRVVEKSDGISVTFRRSPLGELEAGLKIDWKRALGGAVERAANLWARIHEAALAPLVDSGDEVFGEWLWHRLTIPYDRLPSAAVVHARRDRRGRIFRVGRPAGLYVPPPIFEGVLGRRPLAPLCRRSLWRNGPAEGVVVILDAPSGLRWAKWVSPDYRQPTAKQMTGEKNRVTGGA